MAEESADDDALAAMAAFVPDFCSGLGIASLFNLAAAFDTTTEEINSLTSNWSIFLLGPGGIAAVFFIKRYGRLPVLFWSQVLGLGFLIGCALAKDIKVFTACRCLNSFFSVRPVLPLSSMRDPSLTRRRRARRPRLSALGTSLVQASRGFWTDHNTSRLWVVADMFPFHLQARKLKCVHFSIVPSAPRALTLSYSQLVDPRLHQLGAFSLLDARTSAS